MMDKTAKTKKRKQAGFTLVELMIVVAIIGVLAELAIPQYQQYLVRARWAGVWTALSPLQAAVGECAQNYGGTVAPQFCDSTANLANAGFLPSGFTLGATQYDANVTPAYANGALTVDASASVALGQCKVVLTPTPSAAAAGAILWVLTTINGAGPQPCSPRQVTLGS